MTLSYALEGGVSVGSTAAAEIAIFLRMEGAKCAKSTKLCTSAVSIQLSQAALEQTILKSFQNFSANILFLFLWIAKKI